MPLARVLAVCSLVACLLAGAPGARAVTTSEVMVRQINELRAAHGLPPLRTSRSLTRSSFRYSRSMMGRDSFGHRGRIGASRRFKRLGEMIERHTGRRPSAAQVVRRWYQSGGHRALLLDRAFRHVGAGRAFGRYRGRRTTIWVVHLGRR